MRPLVALGGNAIKQADEAGTTIEQFAKCDKAAEQFATMVRTFGPDGEGNHAGLEAVVDKDRAGEVMARAVCADTFMMLTEVDCAFRDFARDRPTPIGDLRLAQAKDLAAEGHFPAGSVGRKKGSAIKFVEDDGARAIVSSLDKAVDALRGRTGTRIVRGASAWAFRGPQESHPISCSWSVHVQ